MILLHLPFPFTSILLQHPLPDCLLLPPPFLKSMMTKKNCAISIRHLCSCLLPQRSSSLLHHPFLPSMRFFYSHSICLTPSVLFSFRESIRKDFASFLSCLHRAFPPPEQKSMNKGRLVLIRISHIVLLSQHFS